MEHIVISGYQIYVSKFRNYCAMASIAAFFVPFRVAVEIANDYSMVIKM